jgi:hypothetical protein
MATAAFGEEDDPVVPVVRVRLEGLGAVIVIPGAILSPADAVAYAQRVSELSGCP